MSSCPASDLLGADFVPDIPHVGFYTVAWQGPQAGSMVVPANLTSVAGSDLNAKRKAA